MKARGGKISPLVAQYLAAMPAEIAALELQVGQLDRSYASIDQAEDHLLGVIGGRVPGDRMVAIGRVARYAGTVLVERTGGRCHGFGHFSIHDWEPEGNVRRVVPGSKAGRLRGVVEYVLEGGE